jgi:hypothetical protein
MTRLHARREVFPGADVKEAVFPAEVHIGYFGVISLGTFDAGVVERQHFAAVRAPVRRSLGRSARRPWHGAPIISGSAGPDRSDTPTARQRPALARILHFGAHETMPAILQLSPITSGRSVDRRNQRVDWWTTALSQGEHWPS